jgi:hypothetical protein
MWMLRLMLGLGEDTEKKLPHTTGTDGRSSSPAPEWLHERHFVAKLSPTAKGASPKKGNVLFLQNTGWKVACFVCSVHFLR